MLLYNNTIDLEFNPRSHRYKANGEWVPSVTTVLGVISKGDALMAWGINQALAYVQSRLQGELTTDEVNQVLADARFAHKVKKQEAASIGTQAHHWLENHLRGESLVLPDSEPVANSVRSGLEWLGAHVHETVAVERRIYSKARHYCGTLDLLARVDGRLSLVDWKTSSGLWPEYFLQTAAYVAAYEEETGEQIEDRWLIRIDKEGGELETICLPRDTLDKDFQAFLGALTLYRRLNELKKPTKKKGLPTNEILSC